jgi:calmodulin
MSESKKKSDGNEESKDQADKQELLEAFSIFDKDSDGTITWEELGKVLSEFGHIFTTNDLKRVIKKYDVNGDGVIDFSEFNAIMKGSVDKLESEKEIDEAFKVFDKDGDGSITAEEIQSVMEKLGEKVTLETIKFMIESVDDNGDGSIDKDEFRKMLLDGPV